MNYLEFTIALIRLSRKRVGIKEASTLFAIADGVSLHQLSQIFKTTKDAVKGQISSLRAKGLAKTVWHTDGSITYKATDRGMKIINETLKAGKK